MRAQQVVDRIVARVEGDVILLSDVRQLSRYQQLLDGKSETDDQILDRLVDQWVVRTEAETSRFPHALRRGCSARRGAHETILRFAGGIRGPSKGKRPERQRNCRDERRATLPHQLSRFPFLRPSVQIDPKAVEDYYEKGVLLRAKARGQQPPTFEAAREFIQEFLVQQGINDEAERWLKESRGRLHVENLLNAGSEMTEATPRRRRWWRWLRPAAWVLSVKILVLAALVVLFFGTGAANPLLRRLIVSRINQMTGGRTELRTISIGWVFPARQLAWLGDSWA